MCYGEVTHLGRCLIYNVLPVHIGRYTVVGVSNFRAVACRAFCNFIPELNRKRTALFPVSNIYWQGNIHVVPPVMPPCCTFMEFVHFAL